MSKKVYYFSWETDSGDRGLSPVKTSKWSDKEIDKYFKENYECDYEYETIFVDKTMESEIIDSY